jgi:hypothetical protein
MKYLPTDLTDVQHVLGSVRQQPYDLPTLTYLVNLLKHPIALIRPIYVEQHDLDIAINNGPWPSVFGACVGAIYVLET